MDSVHRGRPRLEPDPQIRATILQAALAIVQEEGLPGLAVSQVLARTQLSTRALYRHFNSKEELVKAVFVEIAGIETERLRRRMADEGPVGAVVAWIDERLDSAFDRQAPFDTWQTSLEAYSHAFASPEFVALAYEEILLPLIEQIDSGIRMGLFAEGNPVETAISIHGVVWANVERQRDTGTCDVSDVRKRVLRFCLRALGVASDVIDNLMSDRGSL